MASNSQSSRSTGKTPLHAALANGRQAPVVVKALRKSLGLNRKLFARLTGASERAVAGWEGDQPISPVVRKSLRESERLCKALMKVMKPDFVGQWLDSPNVAFSGLKPLDLIERGEVDRLWRMIFEIESGALT